MSTIISDNFDRANSNTVGSGQTGGTWTEVDNSDASNVRILSNQLRIGTDGDNVGGSQGAYIGHGTLTLPCTLSWKYVPGAGERQCRIGLWGTSNLAFQVGVRWNNANNSAGNSSLIDSGGDEGSTFQLDNTVTWYGWLDIVDSGGGEVDISFYQSTTTTKPGSPTATATNATKNADTSLRISFDPSGTSQNFDIDDVLLTDASVAAFIPKIMIF